MNKIIVENKNDQKYLKYIAGFVKDDIPNNDLSYIYHDNGLLVACNGIVVITMGIDILSETLQSKLSEVEFFSYDNRIITIETQKSNYIDYKKIMVDEEPPSEQFNCSILNPKILAKIAKFPDNRASIRFQTMGKNKTIRFDFFRDKDVFCSGSICPINYKTWCIT